MEILNKLEQIQHKMEHELNSISRQLDNNTANVLTMIDEMMDFERERRSVVSFSELEELFWRNNRP